MQMPRGMRAETTARCAHDTVIVVNLDPVVVVDGELFRVLVVHPDRVAPA